MLGLAILAALAALLLTWLLRPNRSSVDPRLGLESWDVVSDGQHNSNTDMLWWRGAFWLVHAASPYHLGTPRCRLVLRRSPDARSWEPVATLRAPGKDIRDPKLLAVGEQLLLYALTNEGVMAQPSRTVLATSADGRAWSDFQPVGPEGWLFWRPKSPDGGRTWYAPAYWHEHGESRLYRSPDGVAWSEVSTIYKGEANDETAIEFLSDGRLLATARLEVTADRMRGNADASTAIAVADPPFEKWGVHKSQLTRLDGPVLFSHAGRVYAVGRHQPGPRRRLTQLGGVWSRKRTALYLVEEERLVHLSDLPSAGDTSYAGVVIRGDHLYVDYYTSRVDRDYPWLLGMFLATDIRMARLPLAALVELAERKAG